MPDGLRPPARARSTSSSGQEGQDVRRRVKTYARSNVKCGGQKKRWWWQTAVFMVEPSGTLKNVIIGKDQVECVRREHSGRCGG
ncbi:hypothetical protein PF005_g8481 [Phytophthora fragariae]|uniref:Probable pectate lyase F n=1 Tax=Phytophthora fragariae TaxID=53985 RepID=A0A6A3LRN0_9STRA|nr:hypothetical protein PF003_g16961 [Phytophthora fragariae]KAE8941136.1 hypothetical protein PF009_g9065 [Phytophthora fragariae]KAE9022251.1 hypothetical protein PF011_g4553 [Phytophthora fragariae]KAE9127341.1 hypothetical protein PF007_g5639 [Phytophthora fragariae]KAE9132886.1 hypothetical protein PF010_g3029 [Phytophthora fragariae]